MNFERGFTKKQLERLSFLAQGKSLADIAIALQISVLAIKLSIQSIQDKLGVNTTSEAIVQAMDLGVIQLTDIPNQKKQITESQKEVLELLFQGKRTREIANILGVSESAIKQRVDNLRNNLNASNINQLMYNAKILHILDKRTL